MLPFWPLFVLFLVLLRSPVPSPEDPLDLHVLALGSRGFGARVTHPASRVGGSSFDPALSGPPAKCHEAWASSGLGLVESRSRCNRLKHSYTRACTRSMREGISMFKGRPIYPHQIPFRIKQLIMSKQPTAKRKSTVHALISKVPGHLHIFQWNASRSLKYHSWIHWCHQSPYDIFAVQESGWSMTNECNNTHWHIVHSADRFASILFMVRSVLIRRDQISIAHHVHGRLLQVRLNLTRPKDYMIVYQQAWSTQHGIRQILSKRKQIWTLLKHCRERLPQRHQIIVYGDFNAPLSHIPHQVHTADPRYHQAAQRDKQTFSQLVQTFELTTLHCRDRFQHTFQHGTHASRIDFALMRRTQISWPLMEPRIIPDFAFNFGVLGPHHHPLVWTIPKWYPCPRPKPVVLFDRHRIRQDMQQNSRRWQCFCWEARQLLQYANQDSPIIFHEVEIQLTDLCKTWFPKHTSTPTGCTNLASLTARVWQARKNVRALIDRLLTSIFTAWKHLVLFRRYHKQVRQYSRQNKKQKLADFLREGADLALRHQTYDWYRKIHNPAALRPICLQHPILKIVSNILINIIKQHTYPTLRSLPLYATFRTEAPLSVSFAFDITASKFASCVETDTWTRIQMDCSVACRFP